MKTEKQVNIFAEILEDTALEQFNSAMAQDFVVAGALMPDAHTGYSLPIGAVVATDGVVVPAWVGYDIGCGMCALKLEGIDPKQIIKHSKEIFDLIYTRIPVGFHISKAHDPKRNVYPIAGLTNRGKEIAALKNWNRALCSLGGGNHFIEIGVDGGANVWVVIHSGSRGVGHAIATHYMTLASSDRGILEDEFDEGHKDVLKYNPDRYEKLKSNWVNKRMGRARPKEGHYNFKVESQEGKNYIQDMNWCLEYALENRKTMMIRTINIISHVLGCVDWEPSFDELINRNHNHAVERNGLWIHRKGATHAEEGMLGVIPGNMRDGSFIVKGKGNPLSLWSSSHGAGRVMSRKQAKRDLDFNFFQRTMADVQALVIEDTLDESPGAYKNIFEVMNLQRDLVEVVAYISPLINIKG